MVMLMVSILCLMAPLALVYGFHARRQASQRALAYIGLALSLVVFLPCIMVMIGSALNVGNALCR